MTCSGANCPRMERLVFYLVTSPGEAYHLLFSCGGIPVIANGTYVRVTGELVKPSTWNTIDWYPPVYFDGDILVQTILAT